MLKRIENNMRFMPDMVKKSGGYYTTVYREVYDATATAAARQACKSQWTSTINDLNAKLVECRTHISQITALKNEIGGKVEELNKLKASFDSVQGYLEGAKINYNINANNKKCMEKISGELDKMSTNCADELTLWKEKQTQYKAQKKDAMMERTNCSLITKTKTVAETYWVQ